MLFDDAGAGGAGHCDANSDDDDHDDDDDDDICKCSSAVAWWFQTWQSLFHDTYVVVQFSSASVCYMVFLRSMLSVRLCYYAAIGDVTTAQYLLHQVCQRDQWLSVLLEQQDAKTRAARSTVVR